MPEREHTNTSYNNTVDTATHDSFSPRKYNRREALKIFGVTAFGALLTTVFVGEQPGSVFAQSKEQRSSSRLETRTGSLYAESEHSPNESVAASEVGSDILSIYSLQSVESRDDNNTLLDLDPSTRYTAESTRYVFSCNARLHPEGLNTVEVTVETLDLNSIPDQVATNFEVSANTFYNLNSLPNFKLTIPQEELTAMSYEDKQSLADELNATLELKKVSFQVGGKEFSTYFWSQVDARILEPFEQIVFSTAEIATTTQIQGQEHQVKQLKCNLDTVVEQLLTTYSLLGIKTVATQTAESYAAYKDQFVTQLGQEELTLTLSPFVYSGAYANPISSLPQIQYHRFLHELRQDIITRINGRDRLTHVELQKILDSYFSMENTQDIREALNLAITGYSGNQDQQAAQFAEDLRNAVHTKTHQLPLTNIHPQLGSRQQLNTDITHVDNVGVFNHEAGHQIHSNTDESITEAWSELDKHATMIKIVFSIYHQIESILRETYELSSDLIFSSVFENTHTLPGNLSEHLSGRQLSTQETAYLNLLKRCIFSADSIISIQTILQNPTHTFYNTYSRHTFLQYLLRKLQANGVVSGEWFAETAVLERSYQTLFERNAQAYSPSDTVTFEQIFPYQDLVGIEELISHLSENDLDYGALYDEYLGALLTQDFFNFDPNSWYGKYIQARYKGDFLDFSHLPMKKDFGEVFEVPAIFESTKYHDRPMSHVFAAFNIPELGTEGVVMRTSESLNLFTIKLCIGNEMKEIPGKWLKSNPGSTIPTAANDYYDEQTGVLELGKVVESLFPDAHPGDAVKMCIFNDSGAEESFSIDIEGQYVFPEAADDPKQWKFAQLKFEYDAPEKPPTPVPDSSAKTYLPYIRK